MTLYHFNLLEENQQADEVLNHGAMIGSSIKGEFKTVLYQLYLFYVEVHYHDNENKIVRVRSFSSTEQLAPYLKTINIDPLFS